MIWILFKSLLHGGRDFGEAEMHDSFPKWFSGECHPDGGWDGDGAGLPGQDVEKNGWLCSLMEEEEKTSEETILQCKEKFVPLQRNSEILIVFAQ